jgi:RsiW-degrading membrane proteinase PrsW (M82 family)
MFWLLVIFFIGTSYLFYRFKLVSNKSIFFKSPLFITVSSAMGLLLLAILLVNTAAPERIFISEQQTEIDSLTTEELDTTIVLLLQKPSDFHYNLIQKIASKYRYVDHFATLQAKYAELSISSDRKAASLGNFCLGVIQLNKGEYKKSDQYFEQVSDTQLPYLHFCRGEIFRQQNKNNEAENEYKTELQNVSGNKVGSYVALLKLYKDESDYVKLHQLMEHEESETNFPEDLARITLIQTHDFGGYLVWLLKTIVNKTNSVGFFAALLIALMWLVYISRLQIFKTETILSLVLFFICGMLCVSIVFFSIDYRSIVTNWSLNGEMGNDFMYSVLMIGVPEEFVKILPLLVLAFITRELKEPLDYVMYGSASALGFAFVENLLYFDELNSGIIHGRAYLSVIGHMAMTTFASYGIIIARFKLKNKKALWYTLPVSFFAACTVHGIFDWFVFQRLTFLFFIFFILIIQMWVIVINNCMNNSSRFSYKLAPRAEQSRLFITIALTGVFALEYIFVGFSYGAESGNHQLFRNAPVAAFLIIFFSSNLSSFDLIKGYWRTMSFSSHEKRGYGGRQQLSPLISWYFVNASRAHNYVGLKISVYRDRHNKVLAGILEGEHTGQIVNRIILYENGLPDPYWFLVKMDTLVPFLEDRPDYILVKLRYQEDSLLYENEAEVYFKAIHNAADLRKPMPEKNLFPFYGWAYIAISGRQAEKQSTVRQLEQRK